MERERGTPRSLQDIGPRATPPVLRLAPSYRCQLIHKLPTPTLHRSLPDRHKRLTAHRRHPRFPARQHQAGRRPNRRPNFHVRTPALRRKTRRSSETTKSMAGILYDPSRCRKMVPLGRTSWVLRVVATWVVSGRCRSFGALCPAAAFIHHKGAPTAILLPH